MKELIDRLRTAGSATGNVARNLDRYMEPRKEQAFHLSDALMIDAGKRSVMNDVYALVHGGSKAARDNQRERITVAAQLAALDDDAYETLIHVLQFVEENRYALDHEIAQLRAIAFAESELVSL